MQFEFTSRVHRLEKLFQKYSAVISNILFLVTETGHIRLLRFSNFYRQLYIHPYTRMHLQNNPLVQISLEHKGSKFTQQR